MSKKNSENQKPDTSSDEDQMKAAAQAALNMQNAAKVPEGYNSVPYGQLTPEQIQKYAADIDPNNPAAGMVAVHVPKTPAVVQMAPMEITAHKPVHTGPHDPFAHLLEIAKKAYSNKPEEINKVKKAVEK